MKNIGSKNTVLLIATLSSFLTPFMGSSINIALPSMGIEFNADAVLLGWVSTSFLLGAAIFLVPFGRLADIYGRKKIFLYGMIIYSIASILCALASDVISLIIFRVFQGTGCSMIFGTGIAMLTSVYPASERGKVMGINATAIYLGLSIGPFAGGLLTQYIGWRSIFLVTVAIGIIVISLVSIKLKTEWADARGENFDLTGSIMYCFSMVSIMFGFSKATKPLGVLLIILGFIGMFFFIRWELKEPHPVLHMDLFFNNRVFAFSNIAAFINYSVTFAVGFLLSLYLQYVKGFSPQNSGLVLIVQPLVMTLLSPYAGRLSDRIEPRLVSSAGMALTVAGLFLLVFLNGGSSIFFITVSLFLFGLGFALFASPNTNAVMSSVEKKFYSVASATLGTMRLTGQMFSMGIAMLMFALCIGNVHITPENHNSFILSIRITMIIFAVMSFFGIFASLARGRIRGSSSHSISGDMR